MNPVSEFLSIVKQSHQTPDIFWRLVPKHAEDVLEEMSSQYCEVAQAKTQIAASFIFFSLSQSLKEVEEELQQISKEIGGGVDQLCQYVSETCPVMEGKVGVDGKFCYSRKLWVKRPNSKNRQSRVGEWVDQEISLSFDGYYVLEC